MLTKINPRLGALPMKLNPLTAKAPSISGTLFNLSTTWCAIVLVYSSDAPGGAWMSAMK